MKKYVLFLFSIFSITASASNITIGINTSDFNVWNMWENNAGKLTHYLYIYNATNAEIKISVRLKRVAGNNYEYTDVATDKTFSNAALPAKKLSKLPYPEKETELDFMEFFMNDASYGVLNINNDAPDKSFVSDKYKYYVNSLSFYGPAKIWVRMVSVSDANTEMSIVVDQKMPGDYCLVKVNNPANESKNTSEKPLQTMQATDASIVKIDKTSAPYTLKAGNQFGKLDIFQLDITIECIKMTAGKALPITGQEMMIPLVRAKK